LSWQTKYRNGPAMVGQLLGARQCLTDQPGDTLTPRMGKALDVMGFPGLFCDGFVRLGRHHPSVDCRLIRLARRLLTVHRWQARPSSPCTVTTAIADLKGHDVTCRPVHGQPQPSLVRLLLDVAAPLARFGFHIAKDHIARTAGELHVPRLGGRVNAGHHAVHEPPNTDTHPMAHAVPGDVLQE